MSPESARRGTAAWARINVGPGSGRPLSEAANSALLSTIVDTSLNVPAMFELTFLDNAGSLLKPSGIELGTPITISCAGAGDRAWTSIIVGEVTSIEGRCENLNSYSVVRGYDLTHRLQRIRRTRAHVNVSDSDIADRAAKAAGIIRTKIEASGFVHDHIGQVDQTDWDFLKQRARETGYELVVVAGVLHYRKASSLGGSKPVELTFRENLYRFTPRVSAGNSTPKVEVRVWDPMQAKVISSVVAADSRTASVPGLSASKAAEKFTATATGAPSGKSGSTSVQNLGPAPSPQAHVVNDRPLATGAKIDSALPAAVAGLAHRRASSFGEADGEASGNPALVAGASVKVANVAPLFAGPWVITSARHVIDRANRGYTTSFTASGSNDRSLLGLAGGGSTQSPPPKLPGVYCGIVTNNNDPTHKGRVKIALPWLSPDYETDWAPTVQAGAGKRSGAMFLPEVGDEVLVGFEFGDPRRAYLLGGIVNEASQYSLGAPAVKSTGQTAAVVLRGLVSSAGNRLVFNDEVPQGGASGPPSASLITLGTSDSKLSLVIDQVAGSITIQCEPTTPNSKTTQGTLNVVCGPGGTINIKAGEGGQVNVDGGAQLDVKAQKSISIQTSGELTLKGSKINLN